MLLAHPPNSSSAETCGAVLKPDPDDPGTMLWPASEPDPRPEVELAQPPKSSAAEVGAAVEGAGSGALQALPQTSLPAKVLELRGAEVAGARGGETAGAGGDLGPLEVRLKTEVEA